jgi:hypothetical protein
MYPSPVTMEIFFSLILASVMVMPTWRAESGL